MNENTLGYKVGSLAGEEVLQIHGGSILRGGYHWMEGTIMISPLDKIRPANKKDFEDFLINSEGYFD